MSDQDWSYEQRWVSQYGDIEVTKEGDYFFWSVQYGMQGVSGGSLTLQAAKRRAIAEYQKLKSLPCGAT